MQKINNLSDLLNHQLKKIFSSEQQLMVAIPRLAVRADAAILKRNIALYMAVKENNFKRLKKCFEELDISGTHVPKYEIVQHLIENCLAISSHTTENYIKDAALAGNLQQIYHFSIAIYETTTCYARTLGKENVARLLQCALQDEKNIENQLAQVAEELINPAAVLA